MKKICPRCDHRIDIEGAEFLERLCACRPIDFFNDRHKFVKATNVVSKKCDLNQDHNVSKTQIMGYLASLRCGTKPEPHKLEPLFQVALCCMALKNFEKDIPSEV